MTGLGAEPHAWGNCLLRGVVPSFRSHGLPGAHCSLPCFPNCIGDVRSAAPSELQFPQSMHIDRAIPGRIFWIVHPGRGPHLSPVQGMPMSQECATDRGVSTTLCHNHNTANEKCQAESQKCGIGVGGTIRRRGGSQNRAIHFAG